MNIRNKRGGEEFLSPWNFLVWALVGVIIVSGVLIFYSSASDVRFIEAEILVKRLGDCIVRQDMIISEFFKENFNIFEKCNFEEKMFDKNSYFYFNIDILNFNNKNEKIKSVSAGQKDYLMQYKLKEGKKESSKSFADCSQGEIYAFYFENNSINKKPAIVSITACSNNQGVKV